MMVKQEFAKQEMKPRNQTNLKLQHGNKSIQLNISKKNPSHESKQTEIFNKFKIAHNHKTREKEVSMSSKSK